MVASPPAALSSSSSLCPPFSLTDDRYDQRTYYGRFRKMLTVVDPRTLFYTATDLEQARTLLQTYKAATTATTTTTANSQNTDTTIPDTQLWDAKRIIDSMTQPDTDEIIPRPFRMAGYIPYNAPISVAILVAAAPATILFWQWSNQTHNALINYYNGNQSQPTPPSTLLQGYLGAVAGACGVSLGLKTYIDRSTRWSVTRKVTLHRFVALPAIVTAAALNVLLMRRNELTTGIDVYYDDTATTADAAAPQQVVVGTSQRAASKALQEMVISRMLLPLPVFLAPPVGISCIELLHRNNYLPRACQQLLTHHPKSTSVVLNTCFVLLGFSIGLPATIAVFPQVGTIPIHELEPRFQHLRKNYTTKEEHDDSQSTPPRLHTLHYNKGL